MNRSEAKEYMLEVQQQKKYIKRKKERVEELLELAASPGAMWYDAIKVQTSRNPEKNTELITEAVDLWNEIADDNILLMNMIHERCTLINHLNNVLWEDILFRKYVKCQTLEDIRKELKRPDDEMYRYDYLSREHGNALEAIAEIITREIEYGSGV